ncbi:MAG: S28 family serine protease [Myxococcales bacterium]|nr:S28 family serine protease [Myxococcales bacterium]
MHHLWWLVLLPMVLVGCSETPRLDDSTRPVERRPNWSFPAPLQAETTPSLLGTAQSLWPLELGGPVEFEATDDQRWLSLPMARSVEGVWATVSSPTPVTLLVGEGRVDVFHRTFVFLPAKDGQVALQLEQRRRVKLSVTPLLRLDTMGGGFELRTEPVEAFVVDGTLKRLEPPKTLTADDTFARLVTVSVRSEQGSTVRVGRCDGAGLATGAVSLEAPSGLTRTSTLWLPAGTLCLASAESVAVSLQTQGRVRRFATTALRAVTPFTLLDTRAAITWKGAPGAGQVLEVPLPRLPGATELVLSLEAGTASTSLGPCDAIPTEQRESGLWVLPADATRVCVRTSGGEHVSLTVLGAVTARDEAPPVCTHERPTFICDAPVSNVLAQLRCIPGVEVEPAGFQRFTISFEQPSDHTRPERGTFRQRLILNFRGFEAPMVLHTPGYAQVDYTSDVAKVFPTNELQVEHRFFGESYPRPLDFDTLTIMQSAADSHRIVEAFSPLFTGAWVSTGHSKGGQTALFHRRFFPCDVAATAPYVTPISLSRSDARYSPYVAQVGGARWASCREAFFSVDRSMITNLPEFASSLPGTYVRIGGPANAIWATTGRGHWRIFQYALMEDPLRGCSAVEASIATDLPRWQSQHVWYAQLFSDQFVPDSTGDALSFVIQTLGELGYPADGREHLEALGPVPTLPPSLEFELPLDQVPPFERRAMPDVLSWLARSGTQFQFLYGGWDPWTGGAVENPGVMDAAKYVVPEGAHGVGVRDLETAARIEAMGRLQRWLRVSPFAPAGNFAPERVRTFADAMEDYPL